MVSILLCLGYHVRIKLVTSLLCNGHYVLISNHWKWWNMLIEYSLKALFKSCPSVSSYSCQPARHTSTPARSVSHTHLLPSPLTLCVWPVVPFTLIKAGGKWPLSLRVPSPHTPSPLALITELSLLLIGVISFSLSPPAFAAIYEKSAGETEAIAFDGRTFIEYHNAVTKR